MISVKRLILSFLLLLIPATSYAQNETDNKAGNNYVKIGFSAGKLSVDFAELKNNSISLEFENQFEQNHFFLSGWAIAYRKEDLDQIMYGQVLEFKTFRLIKIPGLFLKPSFGIEWGLPTADMDRTQYVEDETGLKYTHIVLDRNSDIPGLASTNDGVLHPFFEISAAKDYKKIVFETGLRLTVTKFGINEYHVSPDESFSYHLRDKTFLFPYVFVRMGVRIN